MGYRPFVVMAFICAIGIGVFAAVLTAAPRGREADLLDLNSNDKGVRATAVDRLSRRGGNVVAELLDSLDDDVTPVVRAGLVEAIGKAGGLSSGDAPAVRRLLRASDTGVRHAAIVALSSDPSMAKVELSRLLMDKAEKPMVRRAAAAALGNGGAESRHALYRLANDDNAPKTVRRASLRALAKVGQVGATDVEKAALDATRSTDERRIAVMALANGSDHGRLALTRLAANATPFVRAHAAAGIGRVGSASDGVQLAGMCIDPTAEVRLEALRALVALGLDSTHNAAVVARLGDADVRIQCLACESLANTKVAALAAIQPQLRGLVASPTFLVRQRAAMALFAYGDAFGAAQMKLDSAAGSVSQRKMANIAHGLLTQKKGK